jgi:hypothetical protein
MTDWLHGAVDVHVHSSPSIYPRLFDDDQLVAEAQAAGMRGLLLKAHEGSTVERATMAQKRVTGLAVRGGIVLNWFVGGFNPHAVEMALAQGAAMVWMPTVHAARHVKHFGMAGFPGRSSAVRTRGVEPLTVLDRRGRLRDDVLAVLEIMAARTACLGTGHLGPEEVVALFREAKRLKIERRVMTHAEAPLVGGSFDLQVRMAKEGCFVERSYLSAYHQQGGYPIEKTAAELKRLGPERVVLETDLGQATNPSPIAGLNRYCEQLHGLGVPEPALRRMVGDNPAWLLNLPPR